MVLPFAWAGVTLHASGASSLRVRLSPAGLAITGVYPLFINVHFETLWQVGLDKGQVTARLHHFKAMGVPGKSLQTFSTNDLKSAKTCSGLLPALMSLPPAYKITCFG